jgi:hypothetical protein
MIHHLARAFFLRHTALQTSGNPPSDDGRPASAPAQRPVKARPITPWHTPPRPDNASKVMPLRAAAVNPPARRVRISTDPSDARRTVIAGRFAEVCAALDRLVMEQEAAL